MYIMFLTGVISWIAYGIMRSDFAVLIANIVTLFLAAPVLVITLINRRKKTRMNIAIIGAGPAGIISARNAIKAGHSVVLFEKNTRIGGGSGTLGVVALTVMPVCRTLVIHFIILAFPLAISMNFREWNRYSDIFRPWPERDALRESIRLNTEVVSLRKRRRTPGDPLRF